MSQTPLMLATMHGKIACVEILIEAGANVSKFLIPLFLSPFPLFPFYVVRLFERKHARNEIPETQIENCFRF